MSPFPTDPRRRAFSLIELLVVIAIIAVLAGMLFPAIGLVRSASRSVVCQSNLRQIHLGLMGYASDQHGLLPTTYVNHSDIMWFGQIAPYIEASRNDGSSIHDITVGTGVVYGCPDYRMTSTGFVNFAVGYGMNYWLREPVRYAPGVRWTSYLDPPAMISNYGMFTFVYLSQLDHLAGRALLGDSNTWEFPRWTPDPPRHRGRTSTVFCDGHVAMATSAELLLARDMPQ